MAILGKTTMTNGECYGDFHINDYLYVEDIHANSNYINFTCAGSNVTYNNTTYKGGLINCIQKSVGSATTTEYNWIPNNPFGASEYHYMMGHTATTLNVSISDTYFQDNYHYLLVHQNYAASACNITIDADDETVCTPNGIHTFTIQPAQSLELCAFSPGNSNITYVTYTILYN